MHYMLRNAGALGILASRKLRLHLDDNDNQVVAEEEAITEGVPRRLQEPAFCQSNWQ